MKKFFTLMAAFLCLMSQAWADKVVGSNTLPENGRPEHLYTMRNANGLICGKNTCLCRAQPRMPKISKKFCGNSSVGRA